MAPVAGDDAPKGEVLFEWRQIGDQVRVAAIDPQSGIEVVVFGPAAAGSAALRSLAARKLERSLGKPPADRR